MYKQNGSGLKRVFKAYKCSLQGFKAAYIYETAFRQELLLVACLLPCSFVIASSLTSWVVLIVSLIFLLLVEIINSAIEALADQISTDHHLLLGRAKDLGSSAVFLAIVIVGIIWGAEGYLFIVGQH